MPVAYVHLSDIHFGQERGGERFIHDDVKKELIVDAGKQVDEHFGQAATGIIVTGDTAYGGKAEEYTAAGAWLDKLASTIGCSRTAVQVVPGNHDIDRDGISEACNLMLKKIIAKGESQLDLFLKNKLDRDLLYAKFAAYRPFAEGYDCSLDHSGGPASDRKIELSPGRFLRFIGLNSALICSAKDKEGKLILGEAQRVLPRNVGEELVVLCHHPLNWLRDSDDARRYIRSRARVFVSGHEHQPSLRIDEIEEGCDLMVLASGATVPPKAKPPYTYTYNLLIFDWDAAKDALRVTVIPRSWSESKTAFEADITRLGGANPSNSLGSPNFRGAPRPASDTPPALISDPLATSPDTPQGMPPDSQTEYVPAAPITGKPDGGRSMPDAVQLLMLKFFRDLSPAQRLLILAELKLIPSDFRESLTIGMERRIVDMLVRANRLPELETAIAKMQQPTNSGKNS